MLYLDTSVVVAYYCPEALSEVAEKMIVAASEPTISALTEVEFFSAVSRKIREGELVLRPAAVVEMKVYSDVDIAKWDEEDRLDDAERTVINKRLSKKY